MTTAGMPALLRFMLQRDRAVVAFCLAAVVALAWRWLAPHAGMEMEPDFGFLAAMWSIMMIAMMLPSAAPMILLFGAASGNPQSRIPFLATLIFAAAYLAVWACSAWLLPGCNGGSNCASSR